MTNRIVPRKYADVSGVSLTAQSEKDKTDINLLSQRTLKMRLQGNPNGRQPIYGVMPAISYHEMMNKIIDMDTQFNKLPPKIRRRFHNRPEQMLAFLGDEKNRREALELGLIDDPELAEEIRREKADKKRKPDERDPNQLDLVREAEETHLTLETNKPDDEANPRKVR